MLCLLWRNRICQSTSERLGCVLDRGEFVGNRSSISIILFATPGSGPVLFANWQILFVSCPEWTVAAEPVIQRPQWSRAHQEKHKEIFGHLREVNQLCHEYLRELTINNKNGPQVFAAAYFARGLTCFQSIVALGERGFTDDMRAICRTLVQIFFRFAALSKKPQVVINRLVASAESLRKKRLLLFQSGVNKPPPNTVEVDWNAKIAEVDAALDEIGRSEGRT
jgi:hypothetical protein